MGSWVIAAGIALFLVVTTLRHLRSPAMVGAAAQRANALAPVSDTTLARMMRDAGVYSERTDAELPKYTATFAKTGKNARFYVEYSFFPRAMGPHGWTQQRRVFLEEREHYARGEQITIQIFFERKVGDTPGFGFGKGEHDWMNPNTDYRGRIVALDESGSEEYTYFLAFAEMKDQKTKTPKVTGEHMYAHTWQWEGAAPPPKYLPA